MKTLYLFLALILTPLASSGRDNEADSISVNNEMNIDSQLSHPRLLKLDTDVRYAGTAGYKTIQRKAMKSIDLNMPKFTSDMYMSRATVSSWNGGKIYLTGGIQTMPGLMAIETGSINYAQSFGKFTFSMFGSATKYGYFNGLKTSYGFGAEATYRFSDRVSATVFASYYSPVMIMNPAMAGYVNIPNFGGYFDISISGRFGVQVGAQSYRSLMSRSWEAQPIVKPYFKISEKAAIGVDVGGILYNILKSNSGNRSWGNQNPTMGPPVMKLSEMMGY